VQFNRRQELPKRSDPRLPHKAIPGVGSIILPLGLILPRPQRLGVEERRRAVMRQVPAPRVEAAARLALLTVAGWAQVAAWVVAPTPAAGRSQAAVIAEKPWALIKA